MPHVCLVDGVGRPKVLDLPEEPPSGLVQFAHQGITSGPERLVKFYRVRDEVDPAGRPVYRMLCPGEPPAIRGAYLLPWPPARMPRLRIEGSTEA